jgi:hypothetical protein
MAVAPALECERHVVEHHVFRLLHGGGIDLLQISPVNIGCNPVAQSDRTVLLIVHGCFYSAEVTDYSIRPGGPQLFAQRTPVREPNSALPARRNEVR